jgi:flagellar biosynthesis/type III secretory pathway protein FliH
MSDLTKEQYDQLPDFAKDSFVQDGDKYVPAKDAKLKSTLDDLNKKHKDLTDRFTKIEADKQAEIEEARKKALEEARTAGDVKALEEKYQQQMADQDKRTRESVRAEVTKEFREQQAADRVTAMADTIGASLGVDADAGKAIASLIRGRIKIDPESGEQEFLDVEGKALSVKTRADFEADLKKDSALKRLIKGDTTTSGGGNANGSNGGGGANTKAGNMGGKKDERTAAIAAKFPDLPAK